MAGSNEAYQDRPRRRRGRRALITLVVLLLVLGGLLVAADRIAAGFAERAVADQVRQEAAKQKIQSSAPQVDVGGFPFLTQVLAGRYESVKIVMRDVRGDVEGKAVSLPRLDIDARNVTASLDTLRSGQGEVVAQSVKGTGTITYDSVAKLIDQPGIKLAERNGKLAVTAPLEILGQQFTAQGTANLSVNDGQVALRFEELTAEGLPDIPLARAAITTYAKQISINVPLPALPFHLDVREVRPLPDGLAVSATARDVPLRSTS